MNKEQILEKLDILLLDLNVEARAKVERLYDSGAIDSESYDGHPFSLAEVLLASALRDHVATTASRLGGKVLRDYKNLKHF